MKSIPKLALALALALSGASAASAQTTVYHVAGASSFRVALLTTEVNYLTSITTGTVTGAYAGTSGFTGNNVSLVEAPVSTGTIVFENNLSGSIAGVESVSAVPVTGNANKIAFPTPTGVTLSPVTAGNSTTPASGGTANVTFSNANGNIETTFADIAFSDVSLSTAQKIIKLATSSTVAANSGGTVGVVVYDFVANATADVTDFGSTTVSSTVVGTSTFTSATTTVAVNVTPQNFSNLWTGGTIAGSIFTGNPADSGVTVYATGRDLDSGTRATALAETGFGLKGSGANAVTGAVTQVYPLDGSGNIVGTSSTGTIESFEEVPASSVDGISLNAGDGGYNSGGNEAKALSITIDDNASTGNPKTVLIGYLGVSDAYTALTASGTGKQPAILLGYAGSTFNPAGSTTANGFASQTDINKVYYGQYTFWGYEQVFYNANNSGTNLNDSANPQSVVTSLVSQLKTNGLDVLSSAGVTLNGLKVSRTNDGLQVD